MPSLPATHPILGTSQDDVIDGTFLSDVIGASAGDDIAMGRNGADEVWGGRGDDYLYGNNGHDKLYGSGGPTIVNVSAIPIAGDGPVSVIFEGETAGYRNSFGYYKVDAETGAIYDVAIIWENASLRGSGGALIGGQTERQLDVSAGDQIGFFIVSNGYSYNNFNALADGAYEFRDADGAQATINSDDPQLFHVASNGDGAETRINYHQYHTAAHGETLQLNPDGILHTTGVLKTDAGTLTLGFEDLYNGGDRDFDDSVFTVVLGQSNARFLNAHYRSERGLPDLYDATEGDTPIAVPDYSDNDHLWGGAGSDELWGHRGDDRLYGDNGNDELHGGTGEDWLEGGSGADTLYGNSDNDHLFGGNGDDFLSGSSGDDHLDGGGGDDALYGGAGDDEMLGGLDNDQLEGGGGDDALSGGNGADTLLGGSGDDTLLGGAGADRLEGNSGDDQLEGGSNHDVLLGGSGADTLLGGSGDDDLQGGSGDDLLNGGSGGDVINGGAGVDTVDYSSWEQRVRVDLRVGEAVGDGTDTLVSVENFLMTNYNDKVIGSHADNEISGLDGNDHLNGYFGDDRLLGGDGADTLLGARGNDVLSGGLGADLLRGGSGEDRLEGGAGADELWGGRLNVADGARDVFVFADGCGADYVADFEIGVDALSFTGSLVLTENLAFAALDDSADGAVLDLSFFGGDLGDSVLFAGLTRDDFFGAV